MSDSYLATLFRFGGSKEVDLTDLAAYTLTDEETQAKVLQFAGVVGAGASIVTFPNSASAMDFVISNETSNSLVRCKLQSGGAYVDVPYNKKAYLISIPDVGFYDVSSITETIYRKSAFQTIETRYEEALTLTADATCTSVQAGSSRLLVTSNSNNWKLIIGQSGNDFGSMRTMQICNYGSFDVPVYGLDNTAFVGTVPPNCTAFLTCVNPSGTALYKMFYDNGRREETYVTVNAGDVTLSARQVEAQRLILATATAARKLIIGVAPASMLAGRTIRMVNVGSETIELCGANSGVSLGNLPASGTADVMIIDNNGTNEYFAIIV